METTKVVDKVHQHTHGHALCVDMPNLLQRNQLWNDQCDCYLAIVIKSCIHCKAFSPPKPTRKVSSATLNRSFDEVVCTDHSFLDKLRLFMSWMCTPDILLCVLILAV